MSDQARRLLWRLVAQWKDVAEGLDLELVERGEDERGAYGICAAELEAVLDKLEAELG